MTTARADRLRNDDAILRAAARVLGQDPGATLQSIADAAGVSRPSVYRRYRDRDAIVTALRHRVDHDLDAALDGLPSPAEGVEAVAGLLRSLVGVAARYPVALLRYAPVPGATPAADARVAELLRAGQRAGVLRDDVPAETLNAVVFGVLSAVPAAARTPDPPGPEHVDELAHTVISLLLPGMIPSSKGPR